jgi:hypothetical protein
VQNTTTPVSVYIDGIEARPDVAASTTPTGIMTVASTIASSA